VRKVSEVASILGISKQAVHKKLKQPQYQEFIVKKGSVLYIKDEAISMLKSVNVNQHSDNSEKVYGDKKVDDSKSPVGLYERLLSDKEERINQLTKQVDELMRLLEQQQILTLNSQTEIKLLKGESDDPTVLERNQSSWIQRMFSKR